MPGEYAGASQAHLKVRQSGMVRKDTLKLTDGKTGPRRVFLNAPAVAILENRPRPGSTYVFPSPFNSRRPLSSALMLWYSVRSRAGIDRRRAIA